MKRMGMRVAAGVAAVVLCGPGGVSAQQYFSNVGGAQPWDGATANWAAASGGPYDSAWAGGEAVFEGTSGLVTVDSVTAGGLTFAVGGYVLTNGTLTLTGPTVVANSGATIHASIAGSAGLTKAGAGGTLTLSGVNTYSGGTTVSGGTLSINADSRLGAAGEGVTLAGGTLRVNTGLNTITRPLTLGAGGGTISLGTWLNYNGPITGGQGLYASGSDFILQPPSPNDIGVITQNGSRLFINNANAIANNAAIVMAGGSRLAFQSGTAPTAPANPIAFASGCGVSARSSIPGELTLSTTNVTFPAAGSFTFNVDDQPTRGVTVNGAWPALTGGLTVQVGGGNATVGTVTMNAVLSGSGGLTKQNPGVLLLAASNSLTGGVTAEGGTVRLGNTYALGPVTNLLTVKNGGALDLAGFSPRVTGLTDTLGFGTIGTGLITNSGAEATLSIVRANKAFAGTIAGPVNVVIPTGGSGYQILSGNSTYTGTTTVFGGLETWGTNALGSTAVGTVITNSGLSMKGKWDPMIFAPEPLTFFGNSSFSLNTDDVLKNPTWTGPVTLAQGATMNIVGGSAAGSITITSAISGAGAINKQTANMILLLSGDNTYSGGTAHTAGTLKLGSATALGTGPVTVSGGTLDLNGNSATLGSLSATGGAIVDTAAGSGTTTLTVNQTASTTCAIPLSNGVTRALALTKTGDGVLTLSHTNAFTGAVTISGGALRLGVAAALPSDPTVTSGGTLDLNARDMNALARSVTLAGPGGVGQAGALANTGVATESTVRHVTLAADARIGTTGSKLNVYGTLNGGGYVLTIGGTGEVNIRGDNQLQNLAGVTVNSGLLRLESSQNWPGTYTVNAGGKLDTYNNRTVAGAVHLNGGRLANGGTGAMTARWTGAVTVSGTGTVDTAGGPTVFSNAVTGAGSLVKVGANALTLAGACDLGGTLSVSNGTVTVAGSLACAGGAVAAGATLNGTGTLHARVTDGVAAPLLVSGTLDAAALTLALDVAGPPQGAPHTLIDATGGTLTGRFATVLGVPQGYAVSYQDNRVLLVTSGTLIRLR